MASELILHPFRSGFAIRLRRKRMTNLRRWALVVTIGLPLLLIALKLSPLPFAHTLRHTLSLAGTAHEVRGRVGNVLLVPLGAALIVFFRICLGIRVLGPFRSVLLAIAFQVTGIPMGLFFLSLVIGVIVAMHRTIRRLRLPHFSRLSVMLSAVATIITITLVVARAFHLEALGRAAFFPIVVLTLTADSFAATLRREGARSALWRGTATALVAVIISGIARIPRVELALARYPELILLEIGFMIVISYFFGFRLLSFLNPPIKRKKKRKKKTGAAKTSPQLSIASVSRAETTLPAVEPLQLGGKT